VHIFGILFLEHELKRGLMQEGLSQPANLPEKHSLIRYDVKGGTQDMDVAIKSFDVEMDVKNKGIELEIREPNNGTKLGNLVVTKGHLIWCAGKTQLANGKKIKWTDFIGMVNDVSAPVKKTAAKRAPAKKSAAKKAAKKAASKNITPAVEPVTE
jgi:hypothetical protein